ncbi:hypothetical protein Pfo_031236 [Paulownia fortunei]|nr:hypothetical protein Pfo_031236 [Paulownia fortunei]
MKQGPSNISNDKEQNPIAETITADKSGSNGESRNLSKSPAVTIAIQNEQVNLSGKEDMEDATSIGRHRRRKSIDLGGGQSKSNNQQIVLVSSVQTRRMTRSSTAHQS